ncbi:MULTISPECIES: nucleotide exchange factor GrpE [Bacillaceae]|uniref:Protein GrpE n=1 Tax=Bacillus infantis TaxID=324767 RepID=A0A5D4SSF4_9BACI|nr:MULTISPECIES: nucleotide exchange factor GrpE [Bacillus]MCA1036289.1 nucleotide exchange factor GrpE [Bacillus infantis]MCP1159844.1 nucleotide exchange factor GrpE [Bacillus infantis]MDT0162029.1 nucleotide exchange factor GrpE [Bacillus sp. AG4(2022)]MDW2875672.1 nucleotide exchange factor GrpE [Bacillus infantis]PLR72688.1 nucleotide exchange factor GrpE [Bacillus sp. UMB0728]
MADNKDFLKEEEQEAAAAQGSNEPIEAVFGESAAPSETGENGEEPSMGQEDSAELKAAHEKIAELEAKLGEAENRYLRLQADFDNSRRRAKLDQEAAEKYRAQKLITELLPALDNFERALKMETDNEQAKTLQQGMEMVYRSLAEAIKKEGAEAIEAVGKEFDPHLHQAVMQVEDENFASNTVVEEFQKGYMLKDRVIRPAMVKVNQ